MDADTLLQPQWRISTGKQDDVWSVLSSAWSSPRPASSCRYTRDEDDVEALERDATEESGWKLVHGDVFRPPRHPELLSALVGTGRDHASLSRVHIAFMALMLLSSWLAHMVVLGMGWNVTDTFVLAWTWGQRPACIY
jgi:Endomembrane protein 70